MSEEQTPSVEETGVDKTNDDSQPAEQATKPRRDIKIGSQREKAAKPRAQAQPLDKGPGVETLAPVPTQSNEPVVIPSKRENLSDEQEIEMAALMGEVNLDDWMGGSDTASATQDALLEPDSRHTATIVSLRSDVAVVELAGHNQGILPLRLFDETPAVGDAVEVIVGELNPADGLYELLLPRSAASVGNWSQVAEGMTVDAVITGDNKGGLECMVSSLRAFIPASQASLYRVEDLSQFIGQKLRCVVTEVNAEKQNLVLSHRASLERQREEDREALLKELAPGQVRDGIVRKLQPFGAFVDLGGIDGLIHVSQMSWERIKHPSEILEEGQAVKVKVEKIDHETGKIGLAYRETWENPWEKVATKYPIKAAVDGTVSRLTEFGAFVKLEPGIEGLIHVSEMAHKHIRRPGEVVSEGQTVRVQVLAVDPEAQRIGLSLKALQAAPDAKAAAEQDLAEEEATPYVPRTDKKTLKGGTDRPRGGESFGLQW